MTLFILYFLWYGWSFVTLAIPVISFLCLSAILLNYYNLSIISRMWLCLFVPMIVMALSIYSKGLYYNQQEELDYFTFRFIILASCVFPAIFFSVHERSLLIVASLIGLLTLMSHDPLHAFFGVPYQKDIMKESNYSFTNVVIFITYCIMVGTVIFLKWTLERSEKKAENLIQELNQINEELTEKNTEIEAQNQEITAQSENLNISQSKLHNAYLLIQEQKNQLLRANDTLSSELVEMNKELTETNSELIKHNNELRQFSFTVSHNLRGPVASLIGLVGILDSQQFEGENGEIMSHINTSIKKLDNIIKDLSQIIDIRHDIFQIRQKINLEQEVRDIAHSLKKEIEAHNVKIRTNFTECPEVYSVKPMVHSILYNLISNAIKYRATERWPEVEITSRAEANYIIEIKDNGLGIDLKNQQHNLFKLYKRFHFHTEGKGLGLYLVKLQAEALGGKVEVDSELNKYTKFTVYLGQPENVEQQVLYEQPHARIFYDAMLNSTGVVWNGPVSSEQYRSVFVKCLEFVKAYNTPNYIADLSQQGYIAREDQLWMFNEIMPEAGRHGLKRIAAVKPKDDLKVSEYLKGITDTMSKLGIHQEFFLTFEEASNWVLHENEKAILSILYNGGNHRAG